MKYIQIFSIITFVLYSACDDLDLNPLSEGSSENWFSDQTQLEMSVNSLYQMDFWANDRDDRDHWTDDWTMRTATNAITAGTINGESGMVRSLWQNSYKAISQANTIIGSLDKLKEIIPLETLNKYEAEAKFARAGMYAQLISHYGDVVFFTENLTIDEAFSLGRTNKNTVLQAIYEDYDFAIEHLPESHGNNELKRATKGAALAMKARIALYNEDWQTASDAAKAVMDIDIYDLYPDFRELFLSKTKNPNEVLFAMPRSEELGEFIGWKVRRYITRNAGGWAQNQPSWDLFCSFLCTDGLPIDESPLFDPRNPFENRDPRLSETIVEFGTEHLGYIYQPHLDSTQVLNLNTGKYQENQDNRAVRDQASHNALVWRKWIDEEWSDNNRAETDVFIIRYAEVLLIYAEAKIELGEIDQTVLDAMNKVRARAYRVDPSAISEYPAISNTDQAELRKILRLERRMEFAREGIRYMDIIRWRLAEKVLNNDIYGLLDPPDLKSKIINEGLYFWPETPQIDEDGIVDLEPLFNKGYIKLLAKRSFDASKQYLWPIPSKEILINENLDQNVGY